MDSEIVTYEKPDLDPVETVCWEDVYIMQVHIEVKTNNDGSVGILV